MPSPNQPRWRFAEMAPSLPNEDPVQGEFFSREADLPSRFVREVIQNSMDAQRPDEMTVRVRFVFSGEGGALSLEQTARYLDGLEQHVQAVVEAGGMPSHVLEQFGKPMEYLAVEDFGTTGLTGDVRANDPQAEGNNFWGFFRSIGISPKGADAAGSWGLGKWVFPDASGINAYLGMTQRHGEEDKWLLMGRALLKTHKRNGVRYRYDGSFAVHSDEKDAEWFPLPVKSDDFVQDACVHFNLQRIDGPGLSVIVPYPKEELTPAAIARAVLTQYFLPIVKGDLLVEIVDSEGHMRTIHADTIAREVARIGDADRGDESGESLGRAVALAQWAVEYGDGSFTALPAKDLSEALAKKEDLEKLRERYEQGERLAFRLTTDERQRGKSLSSTSAFCVYLERDDQLTEGHDYFIRGHLRIPRVDYLKRQKARALVLVEGGSALGHLLRDAEGPAHASWDVNAQRLKENWIGSRERVHRVRSAASTLLQALVERQDEALPEIWIARWFPRPSSGTDRDSSSEDGDGSGAVVPPPPPPPPKPREVEITDAQDGFAVRSAKGATGLVGKRWTIRFAYDVSRGSPFKQFEKSVEDGAADFSVAEGGELRIEDGDVEGCGYMVMSENELILHVEADDFWIAVSGFDPLRDVIVDVQPLADSVGDAEDDAA